MLEGADTGLGFWVSEGSLLGLALRLLRVENKVGGNVTQQKTKPPELSPACRLHSTSLLKLRHSAERHIVGSRRT